MLMSMLNGATRWRDVAIWRCPLECSIRVWFPPSKHLAHFTTLSLWACMYCTCTLHGNVRMRLCWTGLVFCLLKNKNSPCVFVWDLLDPPFPFVYLWMSLSSLCVLVCRHSFVLNRLLKGYSTCMRGAAHERLQTLCMQEPCAWGVG